MNGADGGRTVTERRGRAVRAGLVTGVAVLVVVAVIGAFAASATAGVWVVCGLAAALLLGGVVTALAGRQPPAPARTPPPVRPSPAPAPPAAAEVDDLQAFFDTPPGTPAALPGPTTAAKPPAAPVEPATPASDPEGPGAPFPPTPAPATPVDPTASAVSARVEPGAAPPPTPGRTAAVDSHEPADPGHRTTARRIAVATTTAVVVVVVGAAIAAAVRDDDGRPGEDGTPGSTAVPPADPTAAPVTPSAGTALLTAAAAGDLAVVSVPLGTDGLAARLAFEGIVLEPRAVGSTVTRPSLGLTTDGGTALVHLTLPTWNCLSATAPADPQAAGCTPGPSEYADLATPDLQVAVLDGEFELTGDFPTYTRPNGSAPAYTGRTYAVTVQAGPAGQLRDGSAPAAGELRLGGSSTTTTDEAGMSAIRVSG